MSLPRAGETSGTPLLEPLEPRLMPDAAVVINELLADASAPSGDWVELHNTLEQPVDVGGWYLSDDADEPTRYQIPDGFIIPAGGYRVLTSAGHFGTAFGLSRDGERAILSTDVLGMPVTVDEVRFGAAEEDVSFGRYVISTGRVDFVQLADMTPGGPNAGPAIGPVVINEIMYNPAISGDEFIELHNITDSPVRLYDLAYPDHTWTLDGAVEYTFPAGKEIPAGGFVVVTEVDVSTPAAEAAFRAAHGIPGGVAVMGPYTGRRDNAGESIKVYRPGATHLVTGEYAMIRVDRVKYDDQAPWPVEADGDGQSLERNVPPAYGNDPANWHAG
ncbi:MAG: lamin tail domain-containing protein, partial [Planctomycetota bacterium]